MVIVISNPNRIELVHFGFSNWTTQCLQPYRNPTRNPGFFKKPNPTSTRNFETQT
jgi:hypothetical protein